MAAMTFLQRLVFLIAILLFTVAGDQVTKIVARQQLAPGEQISLWRDTVRLQYSENTGAFLSAGADLGEWARFAIFVVGVAIILAVLYVYLLLNDQLPLLAVLALGLVLGGGVGNLVDRIMHDGAVVDFLNLGIGRLRTGIFNLADVFIVGGVLILFVWSVFLDKAPGDA